MTSRERVLKAINHEEPDRLPLDIGSNLQSGIMAHSLDRLRRHLGLSEKPVKIYELYQMLGEVESDIIERLHLDVVPVEPPLLFFDIRRENYKPWKLFDGTNVLVPGQFDVEIDSVGRWLLHAGGDLSRPVEGIMPKNGFYFDIPGKSSTHMDFIPPPLEKVKEEWLLVESDLVFLQKRSEYLRRTTDKALFLGCWGYVGLGSVGSIPDFLMLLLTDKQYVKDLFEIRTENALKNLKLLNDYLGDSIDIIGIDGEDYGAQNNELFNPILFEELHMPFFTAQNKWVHENTKWKTFIHSCGSIPRILPFIIRSGFDIINPVQTTAERMDALWLKETFGKDITFWGGGVDTQRTLPFLSPEEVQQEVIDRVQTFAPGGGFIFNTIHNIQQGTPAENIVAAYDTAYEYGRYPLHM